ncbi:tRNA pseudouridine synthase [Citrus sinensis]|uniref:tRNA pseudouridine synthase n=1 Tax=Citrus sinensis TaxID=2711 RepID=A0ACB8K9A4_CITSI|nr:tRNA pseudouridine synthase [Citrus sinensis]
MTEFAKRISECSEQASKIPEEKEEDHQNYSVEEEEEYPEEVPETRTVTEVMSTNKRIQRYLIAVEYIGTRFSGSQKQLNCRTVVGVLEEAFHKFIGQPVSISLSSRTDAGVHAASNVCHVDVERISKRKPGEVLPPHDSSVVRRAVNHFLQSEGDIMVTDVRCVPSDFHARFRAQERTYFYRILSGPEPLSVFEKDRAWHVTEELDLRAMQEACKVLVGCHDFSSFRASGCQANSPIRTLDELHVSEVVSTALFPSINQDSPVLSSIDNSSKLGMPNGGSNVFGIRKKHRSYEVIARARSFLYHQVRLIVGVLKAVGTGELTVSDVERILKAKTVTAASPMAPACGLSLGFVKYDLPEDDQTDAAESLETCPDPVSRKRRLHVLLAVSIVMDNATEETAATEPQSGVRIAGEAIFAKITDSRTSAELEEAIKEEMKLLKKRRKDWQEQRQNCGLRRRKQMNNLCNSQLSV